MSRSLSLASLTALHLPPPELVRLAAAAGFDLVGALRLNRASDGSGSDLVADGALRAATRRALADTGLGVLDVEVFRLRPGTAAAAAEPLLAVGAELGARFLLTAVEDPSPERRAEVFAELCGLARGYGLRCVAEPMAFSALRTPAEAVALLDAAGTADAGVLVDALHLARAGATPADLAAVGPARLPYGQLCDAASAEPAGTDPDGLRRAVTEAVGDRLPPGEGVLPLGELLDRLPPGAPVSLEVPNPAARTDPAAWIHRVADAARRLLAR
ncbi:sugar phosphate isomerase/epimerase family protein [Geodermatophilus sp. SYSU D00691]